MRGLDRGGHLVAGMVETEAEEMTCPRCRARLTVEARHAWGVELLCVACGERRVLRAGDDGAWVEPVPLPLPYKASRYWDHIPRGGEDHARRGRGRG